MVRNEPINLDGTTRDRAKAKAWQGLWTFVIGSGVSALTGFYLGFVWWGTVLLALGGFFWMVTGLITVFTDYE
jgi:hypothetical protein